MSKEDWRERLRQAVETSGLSRKEISLRSGNNETKVRDILDRGNVPSVSSFARICYVLGKTVAEIYEGVVDSTLHVIVGGSLDGGEMVAEYAPDNKRVVSLDILAKDLAFIEIATDDYQPTYRKGDTLGGVRTVSRFVHNLIKRECIVQATDGTQYVGLLMPGSRSGLYTIRSLIPARDDIKDIRVSWAAPITLIMRE